MPGFGFFTPSGATPRPLPCVCHHDGPRVQLSGLKEALELVVVV